MELSHKWFEIRGERLILRIHVQPKSNRSEVVGLHGDRLKIRIAAPPTDGEANEELLRFLKEKLKVVRQDLEIIRGKTSRQKDVSCPKIEGRLLVALLGLDP